MSCLQFYKSSLRPSGLLLLMLATCGVLAALQYRWTGELARAELARVDENLEPACRQITAIFDAELASGCEALRPAASALASRQREIVHAELFQEWKSSGARPIFRSLGVAVPEGPEVRFYQQDLSDGTLHASDWPIAWNRLRESLEALHRGKAGPPELFVDSEAWLLEFPVMGGPRRELEWVIYEIDRDYAAQTWLPELLRRYLPYSEQHLFSAIVRTPSAVLCEINPASSRAEGREVTIPFNLQGRSSSGGRGPDSRLPSWTLTVRQNPEAVARLVTQRRWRQFSLVAGLCGVLVATSIFLMRQARQARALAQTRMNFVAAVSHEFRTPLTVISGSAHNLQRGIVTGAERQQEYYQRILHHTEDLTELVEQVLAYAGVTTNGAALPSQSVEVLSLVRQALQDTNAELSAAGCAVETSLPEILPLLTGDAAALTRAIRNLLSNAAKHGGASGRIGLSAQFLSSTRMIEITVSDHGPGIPKAERAGIFEPFVRGSAAVAAQTRGSGLGLSLVREIVTAHHGNIRLECPPTGGSQFTISLPVPPLSA